MPKVQHTFLHSKIMQIITKLNFILSSWTFQLFCMEKNLIFPLSTVFIDRKLFTNHKTIYLKHILMQIFGIELFTIILFTKVLSFFVSPWPTFHKNALEDGWKLFFPVFYIIAWILYYKFEGNMASLYWNYVSQHDLSLNTWKIG